MTRGRDLKRRVRARMRTTGERYTQARVEVLKASGTERPTPREPEGQPMEPVRKPVEIFRRFTIRSRRTVVRSENLARREGSPTVDHRHILLGLISTRGSGWEAVRSLADPTALEAAAELVDAEFDDLPHVPYSAMSKRCLEQGLLVSLAAGDEVVNTAHLLAALIDFDDEDVRAELARTGADLQQLRLSLPAPDPAPVDALRRRLTENVERAKQRPSQG